MWNSSLEQQALILCSKAVELDELGDFSEAHTCYDAAIKLLRLILERIIYIENRNNYEEIFFQLRLNECLARYDEISILLASPNPIHVSPKPDFPLSASKIQINTPNLQHPILSEIPKIKFSDICGLESAKTCLKELIILPQLFPKMFLNKSNTKKIILLYGPAGTGKSLLVNACSTEANCILFSISLKSMISKYDYEPQNILRSVFNVARRCGPAIVFLYELDFIFNSMLERARRVATELLIQLDMNRNDRIYILISTNVPWEIDAALERRLDGRCYVPLPNEKSRRQIFEVNTKNMPLTESQIDRLSKLTEGYSGSDIDSIIKLASTTTLLRSQKLNSIQKASNPSLINENEPNPSVNTDSTTPPLPHLVTYNDIYQALLSTKPSTSPSSLYKLRNFIKKFVNEDFPVSLQFP